MGPKLCWPTVDEVLQFRRRVRTLIIDVIDRCDLKLPVSVDTPLVTLTLTFAPQKYNEMAND